MSASNTTSSATKYTFLDKVKAIGPAVVITGSFIGPGTITTATRTGADFGYDLLWTILFAIVATIVLQEMAARLGVVTRQGLSEAISKTFENNALKNLARGLVGVAIPLGCIAYMGGDLTGSAAGLSTLTGVSTQILGPLVGITILVLINFGPFALIEKLLMVLVATMAVVFLVAVFAVGPNWSDVASGLIPSIPDGGMFLVLGLIGTTIVPYNFFVHAINAKKAFTSTDQLELSKLDIIVAITVGGFITAAVMITAGTVIKGTSVESIASMAKALEPVLGDFASPFLSVGLIAAGLSSAIVTPLGASYVLAGLFGWKYDKSDKRFFFTNLSILIFGIFISATGLNPVFVIISAQVLNGIILPIAVILLVMITSQAKFMREYVNSKVSLAFGILISLITIFLGAKSFLSTVSSLGGIG
ncbi:Nramp family divalent metal transporter [Enterovibrio makurazakiensis]|uniref:Nramp family divalent metal transporter n=1 Tax=Enterovibrio gelatinilyticus TaxID=2899819 RepID=A0ABT5R3V5_9GAMM|nr:Nramp family divalent metal transporter [Enterovibrio sp. ZSDZ42]MDD1794560.1 Nramp family divalent metal transporter [Enterovibrio sp. ZSDZ42]